MIFAAGKTRRIRWKLLNWLQRFDNLYRHRNLNVAVIKEKQWEEYRHLRAAQLSGQTADDAIRARATELLDDADKIRVIKEVRQH